MLEAGTGAGINTIAMSGSKAKKIITVEGSEQVARLAQQNIYKHGQAQTVLIHQKIRDCFSKLLEQYYPDLIFLDADHRSETIAFYLEEIAKMPITPRCILIHDIYWSADMLKAWKSIVADSKYPLTVDLFEVGLIFPNLAIEKQHFQIQF